VAERSGLPHFTHMAANKLNEAGVPHNRESDDVVELWRRGQGVGLVTVYRRRIAHKITVMLELSDDGNTVVDVDLLG